MSVISKVKTEIFKIQYKIIILKKKINPMPTWQNMYHNRKLEQGKQEEENPYVKMETNRNPCNQPTKVR